MSQIRMLKTAAGPAGSHIKGAVYTISDTAGEWNVGTTDAANYLAAGAAVTYDAARDQVVYRDNGGKSDQQ